MFGLAGFEGFCFRSQKPCPHKAGKECAVWGGRLSGNGQARYPVPLFRILFNEVYNRMIAKTRNNRIVDPYLNRLLSQYPKTLQYLVIIFYITKCLFTRINSHLTDLFYRVACFRIPAAVASRHLLDTIISMGNSSEINEDKLNNAKRYMHILQEKNRCFSGATAANINLCIQRIKETNHWTLNEISAQLISISTYNEPNTHKGAIMSVLYSRSAVGEGSCPGKEVHMR